MNCLIFAESLDDYMDSMLTELEAGVIDKHVAACEHCEEIIRRERHIRKVIKHYSNASVPHRDDAFFDRVLANARIAGTKHQSRTAWFRGFATAAFVGLVLWLAANWLIDRDPNAAASSPPLPAVSMTLEQAKTINLVFSSPRKLEGATLMLHLPAGVEVDGFSGERRVAWTTRLEEGKNLLPLKLVATSGKGGVVLATLRHDGDQRSFRLLLRVTDT